MPVSPELPAIAGSPLSIVLCRTDDEADIRSTLQRWTEFLDGLQREYEIIVVDNSGTNRSVESETNLGPSHPHVHCCVNAGRAGIGAALRTAIAVAKHPLLVYTDASGSYPPENLRACLEAIDRVDLVSGFREPSKQRNRWRWSEITHRLIARLLFGVRLKEADCLFKLFRKEIFARVVIQSDGPFVHIEILAKANFLGKIMTEVPVHCKDGFESGATGSRVRWRDAWQVFFHPSFGPARLPPTNSPAENAVDATNLTNPVSSDTGLTPPQ
jgi:glycosyltransferase involved in cell wall biosynthesis